MKKKIIILVIILVVIGAGIGIWKYKAYKNETKTCKIVCRYRVDKTNPYWIFQPRDDRGEVIGMPMANYKFSTQKECIGFCLGLEVDPNWK